MMCAKYAIKNTSTNYNHPLSKYSATCASPFPIRPPHTALDNQTNFLSPPPGILHRTGASERANDKRNAQMPVE